MVLSIDFLLAPQTWFAMLFGAVVGSFLNVCIFRIPEGTFFEHRRSVCRECGHSIPFYLNLPVLGWLVLRGRARCCGKRLSVQYPLVELISAVMFAVIYWKYPFAIMTAGAAGTNGALQWDPNNLLRFLHGVIFVSVLMVCSVIDLRHMIIPDVISLPMVVLTPVVVWLHPDLTWQSALIGVLVGGLSLYVIAWVYWLIRHEVGMGMGDVKLLAGIGGWLGYQAIIPTIFYGSVLGAVCGLTVLMISRKLNMQSAIPFGPFLAIGAIIHLVFGSYLQHWFLLG